MGFSGGNTTQRQQCVSLGKTYFYTGFVISKQFFS